MRITCPSGMVAALDCLLLAHQTGQVDPGWLEVRWPIWNNEPKGLEKWLHLLRWVGHASRRPRFLVLMSASSLLLLLLLSLFNKGSYFIFFDRKGSPTPLHKLSQPSPRRVSGAMGVR